jgi:hypothetical protein
MSLFTQLLLSSALQPAAAPAAQPLWRIVLGDIPRDAGAIVVYALIGGTVWFIWWANRHSGESRPGRATTLDVAPPEAHAPDRPGDQGGKPRDRGTPKRGRPRSAA